MRASHPWPLKNEGPRDRHSQVMAAFVLAPQVAKLVYSTAKQPIVSTLRLSKLPRKLPLNMTY